MAFNEIIEVVLPVFITILIGWVIGKKIKVEISGVIDIVFYVGLPALVFVTILNRQIVLLEAAKIWASVLMVSIGCGVAAWLVFKLLKEKHTALYLPIALPNSVNIPFPIISLAYGTAGLFAVSLYQYQICS